MRKTLLVGLVLTALALAGCGGGGGGASVITSSGGSSGSGSGGQTIASPAANVVTMTVDSGPNGTAVDIPYISVTLCVPGTAQCQTFNHIEVDTGSYGLRIVAGATDTSGNPFALALPQETINGATVAECTQFVDGYSWGPMATADIDVSGESAQSVPVQVIGGDPNLAVPSACASTGSAENTVSTFGANGILGVGVFPQDCGQSCVTSSNYGYYYACPSGGACQGTTLPLAEQASNPAFDFPTDNNGVIVELPPLGSSGIATTVSGALVFGIGTEGNNSLNAQTVLPANSSGDITTVYNGQSLPYSFFDTGSNAYYFVNSSIPDSCVSQANWFCPSTTLQLTALNTAPNGTQSTVAFSIANAGTLFQQYPLPQYSAFANIGANAGNQSSFCPNQATNCSFDFGLPFFFGRNVYVAFYGALTSGGTGPYFAY